MDITQYLTHCVQTDTPVSFSKYGDGEYFCAIGNTGHNCDYDNYTDKKAEALITSIKYMVESTNNAYISKWPDTYITDYWQSLVSKPINWGLQHTILFDGNNDDAKVELYKSIKYNKTLVKVIICNDKIVKVKTLLDLDHGVIIPENNWFDTDFDTYLQNITSIIQEDGRNPLIITCCGINAKIMIYELSKIFPNGIYLDFGSGLDKICTQQTTRLCQQSYDYLVDKLKDILPDNWNNNQQITSPSFYSHNNTKVEKKDHKYNRKRMPYRLQKHLIKK